MAKNKELLGGQALIEGVMMKGPKSVAYAVYDPKGKLNIKKKKFIPIAKRIKLLGFPFIRGFVNLIEMLRIGMDAINYSSEIAMPEEAAKQSKYEMPISIAISFSLAIFLFIFLPASSFNLLKGYIDNLLLLNLCEGLVRITIFFIFLGIISLSKDMRRVFAYHGAEHMTVYAYEDEEELTLKNIKKKSTLHPRCGTSFLLVVMITSIIVFSFLGRPELWQRVLYKLALMPIVAGISYEFVRLVARFPKFLMKIMLAPGLLLQLITTKKPDDKMIKAAVAAIKEVL